MALPNHFIACCQAEVQGDRVYMYCDLENRNTGEVRSFDRAIDLAPILDYVSRKFADYREGLHEEIAQAYLQDQLYSETQGMVASGVWDYVKKAAGSAWDYAKAHKDDLKALAVKGATIAGTAIGGAAVGAYAGKLAGYGVDAAMGDSQAAYVWSEAEKIEVQKQKDWYLAHNPWANVLDLEAMKKHNAESGGPTSPIDIATSAIKQATANFAIAGAANAARAGDPQAAAIVADVHTLAAAHPENGTAQTASKIAADIMVAPTGSIGLAMQARLGPALLALR